MRERRARVGGLQGWAETTSRLGTTLKAGRRAISLDLQPARSASGRDKSGLPKLGVEALNPTGVLKLGKKGKGRTMGAF